jgi:hypothetical protein
LERSETDSANFGFTAASKFDLNILAARFEDLDIVQVADGPFGPCSFGLVGRMKFLFRYVASSGFICCI